MTPGPERETLLFDMESDPFQLVNAAEDPAHAALRAELSAELKRRRAALG